MRIIKTLAAIFEALVILAVCAAASGEPDIIYEIKEDFSGAEDGMSFKEYAPLTEHWTAENATEQHRSTISKEALTFRPFSQLILKRRLTGPYVFRSDIKVPDGHFFGVFVRSTGEALSGTPYFEQDGTLTKKGDADNEGIGSTGVYVIPRGKRLLLCVKTADETQTKGIGTDKTFFDHGADFSAAFTELCFEDDGKTVKILVSGELVCYIELSEITETDFMSACRLYTKADIYGADGQLVKTVVNCRICADYSIVAYGMRIDTAGVDNVYLCEYEKPAEETEPPLGIKRVDMKCNPEKYEYLIGEELDLTDTYLEITYENNVKEDVKVTADMVEDFDNTTLGVKLLTVKYGNRTANYSVKVVEEYGKETETERETIDFDTSPAKREEDAGKGGGKTITVIIAAAVTAAVCVALVILVIRGKKSGEDEL